MTRSDKALLTKIAAYPSEVGQLVKSDDHIQTFNVILSTNHKQASARTTRSSIDSCTEQHHPLPLQEKLS